MAERTTRYEKHAEIGRSGSGQSSQDAAAASSAAVPDAQPLGAEDEQLAASLSHLGQLKYQAMHYVEAEALFRRALEIRERLLGPQHFGIVESLTNLAAVHGARGELGPAESLLQRALSVSEAYFGSEHHEVGVCLSNLAQLYLRQNEVAKAEPLLLRLLEMRRSQGEDNPEVATILASLAGLRSTLGQHDVAEQMWRRALRIRERTLVPNHFLTVASLDHLADACAAQGKLEEAIALLGRALEMREKSLSPSHPSLVMIRDKVADLQLLASQEMLASSLPQLFIAPHHREPAQHHADSLGALASLSPLDSPSPAPQPPKPLKLLDELEPEPKSRQELGLDAKSLCERERPTKLLSELKARTPSPREVAPQPNWPRELDTRSLAEVELEAKAWRERGVNASPQLESEPKSLRERVVQSSPTYVEPEEPASAPPGVDPVPTLRDWYIPGQTVLVPPRHEVHDMDDDPHAVRGWPDARPRIQWRSSFERIAAAMMGGVAALGKGVAWLARVVAWLARAAWSIRPRIAMPSRVMIQARFPMVAAGVAVTISLLLVMVNRKEREAVAVTPQTAMLASTTGGVKPPAPRVAATAMPEKKVAAPLPGAEPVRSTVAPGPPASPGPAKPAALQRDGPSAEAADLPAPNVETTLLRRVISAIESMTVARVDSASQTVRVAEPVFDSKRATSTAAFKPPAVAPGSPMPKYPESLWSSAIEGQVLAEFMVEAHGRANMTTFRVLESDHPLFETAVRKALMQMRFSPAEIGGRKVAQRLVMPFKFDKSR